MRSNRLHLRPRATSSAVAPTRGASRIALMALVALAASATVATASASGAPSELRRSIERRLYAIEVHPNESDSYLARNAKQGFAATFDRDGVTVSLGDTHSIWGMNLAGYGRLDRVERAGAAELVIDGNRITYERKGIAEWYVNDPRGIEQGFTIEKRPDGEGPLVVDLGVHGALEARAGSAEITFEGDGAKLGYAKLYAFDASGKELTSRMEIVRSGGIDVVRLSVEDANAPYPVVIDPLLSNEKKILASDATSGDEFGYRVAVSGDTAVVGAWLEDGPFAAERGAAYVLGRDVGGPNNWGQVKKLRASDPDSVDRYAEDVGIDGDTIIIGSIGSDDNGTNSGSAYVYERHLGGVDNWGEAKKLNASDASANAIFGSEVAISGDTIIISAKDHQHATVAHVGAVYVFQRNLGGADNWGELKTILLPGESSNTRFGWDLSMSGDTLVVASLWRTGGSPNAGMVSVFERNLGGADNWGFVKSVTGSSPGDSLGYSVSISGDTFIAGAPYESGVGAAYVHERNLLGPGSWGLARRLTSSGAPTAFGWGVAIHDDLAVVGDPFEAAGGSVYLYERDLGGPELWAESQVITGSDTSPSDRFGIHVVIQDDTLLVGSPSQNSSTGAVYVYRTDCGNGVIDAGETCDDGNTANGDCCSSSCTIEVAGTECRAGNGVCDVAETCDGVSASCPADAFATDDTECRGAVGVCDVAETCTGASASCPTDLKSTSECRATAGLCDVAESCDGVSDACPADEFLPVDTECRGAAGACDLAEVCTGASASCPADLKSTAACRASGGVCDVAEVCDGVGDSCPADSFAPSTTECRSAAGVCDLAEMCTGSDAACPADAKSTAQCRASDGLCDVAEVCDGVGDSCPADGFLPNGTECRGAAGACDVAELCDGSSAACPFDAVETAGTECRGAAGVCDVAEQCDGSAATCPADAKSTAECRAASGVCDVAESCDGVNDACPVDGFEAAGTACPDGDLCNGSETCDGSGTCQPDPDLSCDDTNPCTQDSCDPVLGCSNDAAPAVTCADAWEKAQLLVNEKAPGKEKIVAKFIKGPALTQADFGDPVFGTTAFDVCIYDDLGQLAGHMQIDRAAMDCAGKDCWKALGTKGFLYKDKDLSSDGVQLLKILGGDEGKSKILMKAKNNSSKGQASMPVGISAALAGSTSATLQLHGSDSPVACYSTTLTNVISNDASFFKAK